MEHLVIGAAQSAHVVEYARSWERALGRPPQTLSWADLCGPPPILPVPAEAPLAVRLAAPAAAEVPLLARFGQTVPTMQASAAFAGLCRALLQLQAVLGPRAATCFAAQPQTVQELLDRDSLRRVLAAEEDLAQPTRWILPGDPNQRYQALRERLRHDSAAGVRVLLRLSQALGPAPQVVVWQGGRGLRGRASCQALAEGLALTLPRPVDDEEELRALLLWMFAHGAVAEQECATAELAGQPYLLSLLVTQHRVALGAVVQADPLVARVTPLVAPGTPDFPTLRRQLPGPLLERLESLLPRLVQRQRCAALVVDVALSRRLTDFVVLACDPFAQMPAALRDATGWSGTDHLVRAIHDFATGR